MLTAKERRQLAEYLRVYCPEGWRAVQQGRRASALPKLTALDKAAIFHYTDDGFEGLNQGLHASGVNDTLLGRGLAEALARLPPHEDLAYAGVRLRPAQLAHYRACAGTDAAVSWPAFLSASQKEGVAYQHLHSDGKNCLFVIQSRTGRLIEEISRYGVDGQNEYEVLFAPHARFTVEEVVAETGYTRIVLDEL